MSGSSDAMQTVLLALAQHHTFSDVLRGKFLPALADRFRVIVLTPLLDSTAAKSGGYLEHPNVAYEKLPLAHEKLWVIFDKYLRVPLTRELDHLVYMRHFYRRNHWWPRKLLMRGRVFLPRQLFTIDRLTRWEERLADPSPAFRELVRRHQPALLITATPGFKPFEAEMILFAKRFGLPSVAIDINYDNLTSTGKLIRKTNYLMLWNELMRHEAKTLHRYPDERLRIVGCLRFDHYFYDPEDPAFPSRDQFLRSKGLDPSHRLISYAGPTPANYPPRREFVAELLRLRREGKIAGNPNLLVRLHPNDNAETYRDFAGEAGVHFERASRKVHTDAQGKPIEMDEEDSQNLTATLTYADVVLNFASTVAMEACIFDRPVINIAFPEWRRIVYHYEYNKYIVDTGAVRLANSPGELAQLINMYFRDPALDRPLRKKLVDEFIPYRDGKSWLRTVEGIQSLAGGTA